MDESKTLSRAMISLSKGDCTHVFLCQVINVVVGVVAALLVIVFLCLFLLLLFLFLLLLLLQLVCCFTRGVQAASLFRN